MYTRQGLDLIFRPFGSDCGMRISPWTSSCCGASFMSTEASFSPWGSGSYGCLRSGDRSLVLAAIISCDELTLILGGDDFPRYLGHSYDDLISGGACCPGMIICGALDSLTGDEIYFPGDFSTCLGWCEVCFYSQISDQIWELFDCQLLVN